MIFYILKNLGEIDFYILLNINIFFFLVQLFSRLKEILPLLGSTESIDSKKVILLARERNLDFQERR